MRTDQRRLKSRAGGQLRRPPSRDGWSPSLPVLATAGAFFFAATLATLFTNANFDRKESVAERVKHQDQALRTGLPPTPPPPPAPGRLVWWHAPFFSGGGMGVEALQFVLGLQRYSAFRNRVLITSHGDIDSYEVFAGLDRSAQQDLVQMLRAANTARLPEDAQSAIIVCHSEPGAWALPRPLYQTSLCPPLPLQESAYVVARAMFETDRLSQAHVERCNQMHEVWVPTEFHRQTFAASGVAADKLVVVPEPVDVEEYDPTKHNPLPLPMGERAFGPAWPHAQPHDAASSSTDEGGGGTSSDKPFVFLSVFKWETRKGWDVLLRAYLSAFTAADNVLLLLHTKPFHSDSNFAEQMQAWARKELGQAATGSLKQLPSVYVLGQHIPQRQYPRLFKSADAFVLPTRGEGWGLPVVEAMSMGLPVIVTNFSGPTAYLDETVGYPLRSDGLADIPEGSGAFSGHRWAQPSIEHLRQLMRHVAVHRQEAAARGRAARRRMASHYSVDAVAELAARELRRIEVLLAANSGGTPGNSGRG